MSSISMLHVARRLVLVATLSLLAACSSRDAAPQFTYTLLDGSKHSSAEQRGKVLLVNFWATSCTSCVKEMPQIV